jgi:hypothetical protein
MVLTVGPHLIVYLEQTASYTLYSVRVMGQALELNFFESEPHSVN